MLSIRMQRTGRKGHATFRLVVQESRLTPTSGKVVAQLGSFDPHSKNAKIDTAKAILYMQNGAQPSDRAAALLQKEGVELPSWVVVRTAKNRTTRHPDKLRRNQPAAEPEAVEEPEAKPEEAVPVETSKDNSSDGDATIDVPADAPEVETGTTES